jgi:hypothetical protein
VLIIASLFGGGIFAQTNEIQARMVSLLLAAGSYASLWLLNESNDPVLFSIGAVFAGSRAKA